MYFFSQFQFENNGKKNDISGVKSKFCSKCQREVSQNVEGGASGRLSVSRLLYTRLRQRYSEMLSFYVDFFSPQNCDCHKTIFNLKLPPKNLLAVIFVPLVVRVLLLYLSSFVCLQRRCCKLCFPKHDVPTKEQGSTITQLENSRNTKAKQSKAKQRRTNAKQVYLHFLKKVFAAVLCSQEKKKFVLCKLVSQPHSKIPPQHSRSSGEYFHFLEN